MRQYSSLHTGRQGGNVSGMSGKAPGRAGGRGECGGAGVVQIPGRRQEGGELAAVMVCDEGFAGLAEHGTDQSKIAARGDSFPKSPRALRELMQPRCRPPQAGKRRGDVQALHAGRHMGKVPLRAPQQIDGIRQSFYGFAESLR